jgi:hypothetical protein
MSSSHDDRKMSAASILARSYTRGPEWFLEFREADLGGDLAYEEGVIRRESSCVYAITRTAPYQRRVI